MAYIPSGRTLSGFVMVLLTTTLILPTWAGDTLEERATLKGISAVGLLVENLGSDAEKGGLTRKQLGPEVEHRLRKAGINVTPTARNSAIVYINVSTSKSGKGLYAYSIRVELLQRVHLGRAPEISLPLGTTWYVGSFGTVRASNLPHLRAKVGELVDKFIHAYLEQNPKQ
jgi:hypothetical protein